MLIEHLLDVGEDSPEAGLLRTDPNAFYQAARRKFDSDPGFAERARKRVVDLQGGDPATLALWQEIVDLSKDYLHRIYGRLCVTLADADIRGESFYNDLAGRHGGHPGGQGHRGLQRRRAVRVPARLHRPRGQAAAAHHPQERRRLQLRHHRPGHHPVPGRRAGLRPRDLRGRRGPDAALPDGLRGSQAGGLDPGRGQLRARRDRPGARPGRQPAAHQVRRQRAAQRPAGRSRGAGQGHPGRPGGAGQVPARRAGRRSPRRSASAR